MKLHRWAIRTSFAALLSAALPGAVGIARADAPAPVVTTASGAIEGTYRGEAAEFLGIPFAAQPSASEFTLRDGTTKPENLTVTRRGDLIVGSAAAARIDIIRRGSTTAETFADLSADGGVILGVLADQGSGTLWACHIIPGPDGRRSDLRGFNLQSGKQILRWDLPGYATCNDFSVGPDRALYISDTNGKLYRLPRGAQVPQLLLEDPRLDGVDGITFLGGQLYIDNVRQGRFYRVERRAGGLPSLVEITIDGPVERPDGMRAARGRLFVAEGGGGRILALTVRHNTAKITVLKSGLKQPTGVEPAGRTLWYTERAAGKVGSLPMPQ